MKEYLDVLDSGITFRKGEYCQDTMTEKLPGELKKRILAYMKTGVPELMSGMPLYDPVTGENYTWTNTVWTKDGYWWSTAIIYMFEHYDVRLSADFLRFFQSRSED